MVGSYIKYTFYDILRALSVKFPVLVPTITVDSFIIVTKFTRFCIGKILLGDV